MGENSIINISESRVNVWETERVRVVCDRSLVARQRTLENAAGVDRREIGKDTSYFNPTSPSSLSSSWSASSSSSSSSSSDNPRRVQDNSGRSRERQEREDKVKKDNLKKQRRDKKKEVKEEKKSNSQVEEVREERRVKKCRHEVARSRGFVASTSSCARLIQRVFLLFLSLLGTPFPSSSAPFSSAISRGGPALVSGSFLALVSLLVVLLLRPTMAIPTVAASAGSGGSSGNIGGASTGASTSAAASTINDPTLARMIQRQTNAVVIGTERREIAMSEDEVANFESVIESTTMKIRRRRHLEYTRQSSYENYEEENYYDDDEEEEDDDDDEEEEEEEEDAFPASLIPHTRESGLEMRSRLGEAELDTIRRSIVEGLGLERIPDPSKANVSQTEYRRAHEEYLTRLQHSRDSRDRRQRRLHTFHPAERLPVTIADRTRRSVSSSTEDQRHHRESSITNNHVLYFPIEIPDNETSVDHATLRFLSDPTDTPVESKNHVISLYRFVTANSREFVSRHKIPNYDSRGPKWIELDVTELTNLWQGENFENFGLELIFEYAENNRRIENYEKKPTITDSVLNIFTSSYPIVEDARGVRRKRRANPEHLMSLHKGRRTECRGENKKCCRHEMTVIFKDLKGFEFIVQPKNFDAGYCKGRCPPRYNPAHHHALLQSLIWKGDKKKAPRPCCAPSKLDDLEILYFDENDTTKLKVSKWKNMKVLECACS